MTDSTHFSWHLRPGLFLSIRYLRSRPIPVIETSLDHLPRLSKRMIRFALWAYPRFLDRADLTFPIIVAGRGRWQITLDGRHRISKAIWTQSTALPTVRVPLVFATELLFPGIFEVEWLALFLRGELRRAGRRRAHHPDLERREGDPHPDSRAMNSS